MYILSILVLFFASDVFALKYTDCGSKTGRIVDVRLTGCEDSDICELKRGETYTYGLSFESFTDSEKLTASVYGVMDGVSYPYPLPNDNACETEDIDCPIQSGKIYDVENTFTVVDDCPPMRFDVKWDLKDDNKEMVICGVVPMEIV